MISILSLITILIDQIIQFGSTVPQYSLVYGFKIQYLVRKSGSVRQGQRRDYLRTNKIKNKYEDKNASLPFPFSAKTKTKTKT